MTPLAYLAAARKTLDHFETTQLPAVEAAADLVVHALTHGGTVHCSEIGHGIHWDFIHRAGGLFAVKQFTYSLNVTMPVPGCHKNRLRPTPWEAELEAARYAVRASNLRAGDVLVVASVSGRNRPPIELALAAREAGVRTIGFTALTYTREIVSLHPSGQKLCDVVDVVVDNGAPFGDAGVDIPGYDHKLIPMSGLGMVVAGWMIWGRVMEKMAAAGTPASVYISHNRPGGPEHNSRVEKEFEAKGY